MAQGRGWLPANTVDFTSPRQKRYAYMSGFCHPVSVVIEMSRAPTVSPAPGAGGGRRLPRRARGWHFRLTVLGAGLGLGLGTAGQVAVELWARGTLQASVAQRVVAVAYSTAAWTVLALLIALATSPWRRWAIGRVAAVTVCAGTLTLLALTSLLGLIVRVVSGSFLTVGAVHFALASRQHFARAAVGEYRGWLVLFSVLAVGLSVAFAAWLLPARQRRGTWRFAAWRPAAAAAATALILTALFVRRGDLPFTRGMFRAAPLLALASSADGGTAIAERVLPDERVVVQVAYARGLIHPGPPIDAGRVWRAAASQRNAQRVPEMPNVLFVMLESVSPRHLGFGGKARPVTPEMDRLAGGGLRLRRAWTSSTHSNYAQPAALSALFPYRRTTLDQYQRLDYPRVLFHDLMFQLGYDTAMISSQDETWQGIERFQTTATPTFHRHAPDHPGPYIDTGTERIVPDELTVDLVLTWLSEPRDRPWALYLNLQTTHFPYTIPDDAKRPYQPSEPDRSSYTYVGYPDSELPKVRNRFDNALSYVDQQVGRLRQYLEDTGEFEHTLWVLTSDHGELFGEHDMVTHGRTLFDAEARVPIVLFWPGVIEPADSYEPASHLDILPTLSELLGVPPHPSFQGRSLAQPGTRTGPQSAVFMTIQGWRYADAIVCWPWKLIVERATGRLLLFHLERDPPEVDNLVDAHPTITARLGQILDGQLRAQLDYYDADTDARKTRFAPRLSACPELPRIPRAPPPTGASAGASASATPR